MCSGGTARMGDVLSASSYGWPPVRHPTLLLRRIAASWQQVCLTTFLKRDYFSPILFFLLLPIVVGSVFVCSVDCMAWFRSLSSLHSKTSVNTVHRLFIIWRWLNINIYILISFIGLICVAALWLVLFRALPSITVIAGIRFNRSILF
jgi:hypothetical protein